MLQFLILRDEKLFFSALYVHEASQVLLPNHLSFLNISNMTHDDKRDVWKEYGIVGMVRHA